MKSTIFLCKLTQHIDVAKHSFLNI